MSSWEEHQRHVEGLHGGAWKFICGICDDVFESKELALAHRNQLHFSTFFHSQWCHVCKKDIKKTCFQEHMKLFHSDCLICVKCDKVTQSKATVEEFKSTNTGETWVCEDCRPKKESNCNVTPLRFECKFCDKVFSLAVLLQVHQEYNHDPEMPWQCYTCYFTCQEKQTLDEHLNELKHTRSTELKDVIDYFTCKNCHIEESSYVKFKRHIKKCHLKYQDWPHRCSDCLQRFLTISLLEKHKQTYCKGPQVHQCKECGRTFNTNNQLVSHFSTKHRYRQSETNEFKCNLCTKNFEKESDFKAHLRVHENHSSTCEFCGIKFCKIALMKAHMFNRHPDGKTYLCRICDFKTELKQDLEKHQIDEHGSILQPEYGEHRKCQYCDYVPALLDSLTPHTNKFHCGLGKPFMCDQCSASFKTNVELTKHRNKHTWDTIYVCDYCGEKYSQKWSLTAHIRRTHQGFSNNFKVQRKLDQ